jgi:hypothetical protein
MQDAEKIGVSYGAKSNRLTTLGAKSSKHGLYEKEFFWYPKPDGLYEKKNSFGI